MNKKILFLMLSAALLTLPSLTYAAPEASKLCDMIDTVKWITWWIGGSIVVIGWVIAGILYLTAAGGERMGAAKKALVAAIIGTVLVILSMTAADIVQDTIGETGDLPTCEGGGGTY